MTYLLLNLFLALIWMMLNGSYTSLSFIAGFAIGLIILRLSQPFGLKSSYFRRFSAVFALLIYFGYEVILSSARVVWDVITPTHLSDPDILYIPLDVQSDLEITLLANMVSLTPGSLSLDVTSDKKYLIVHAMFASKQDQVVRGIKQGLEKRILEVTRD